MGWSGLFHPMELTVPPHGKDSKKALLQVQDGTLTERKTMKKTAFRLQK
jgi:hypothetical protein